MSRVEGPHDATLAERSEPGISKQVERVLAASVHSIIGATATRRSTFDAPTELLLRRVVIQTLAGVTL